MSAAPTRVRSRFWMTFAALAVGALVYSLSQSMVAPALPNIQRALHTSTTNVTWVFTAFLLAASVAAPITGRLGDMFGKRRILLIVIACFGAGTVVSALASSIGVLICGRVIQGVGAGVFPLAFGIIRDEFPADQAATVPHAEHQATSQVILGHQVARRALVGGGELANLVGTGEPV